MQVSSASDVLRTADELFRAGRMAEAEHLLRRTVDNTEGELPELLNLLGAIALQGGRLDPAEAWLRRAIAAKPDHGIARCNLAQVLCGKGRLGEAVASVACAIAADAQLEALIDRLPGGLSRFFAAGPVVFQVRAVPELATWADRNNYTLVAGPPLPVHPVVDRYTALPENFARCLAEIRDSYAQPPRVVRGEDVTLCFYYVSPAPGYRDEVMNLFGRNKDILAEPFWLDYSPVFARTAGGNDRYGANLVPRTPRKITLEGEYFFLGGRRIFGHWLGDFLPKLLYLQTMPELRTVPVITPPLSAWQRESLSYFNIANPIVELDVQNHIGFFSVEKLWIPGELPLPTRLDHVRTRFRAAAGGGRRGGPSPTIAYLSRQGQSGRERVANEDDIVAYLQSRGVEILYPEKLSIQEKIERFRDVDVFICPPGSANFNYFIFSRPDSVMVNLWPAAIVSAGGDSWFRGALVYNMPFLDRTVFLLGRFLREAVGKELLLDVPALYGLPALAEALDRAVALFETPASATPGALMTVEG